LNAALTIAYGSTNGRDTTASQKPNPSTGDNLYYLGVRGSMSLIPGFTGGVYYGYEGTDILANTLDYRLAYGLDFKGKLFGLLDLEGEWNAIDPVAFGGNDGVIATYAKAGINLGAFTVGGNWRYVNANFSGRDVSNADGPYKDNQNGFGVDVGLNLGLLDLGFYYDQRTATNGGTVGEGPKAGYSGDYKATSNSAADRETQFGAKLGIRLIGFDIAATYDVGVEATGSNAVRNERRAQIRADHDGSKAGALIGGLNLSLGYRVDVLGLDNTNTIWAYADTKITLGGFSIAPKAYFRQKDAPGSTGDDITTLGGGVAVNTDFLFGAKLGLNFAYETGNHSVNPDSSTQWASIGLSWNPSIFAGSTFSVTFADRIDINTIGTSFGPSFGSPTGTWGDYSSGAGGRVTGLYLNFEYYGINFAYGIFSNVDFTKTALGGAASWGQAVRIAYTLKF
jgi:hypothetical protein